MDSNAPSEKLRYQGFLQTPLIGPVAKIQHVLEWNTRAETKPTNLPTPTTNLVFGKRMEQYLAHFLAETSAFKMAGHGIQIIENETTLGELDFVLVDHFEQQLVHLELAYKFYCFDPQETNHTSCFVGPNRNDKLSLKLAKLKNRQFPLLFSDACQNTLQALKLPEWPWVQACCLKAQLYMPNEKYDEALKGINPSAIAGTWLRPADLTHFAGSMCVMPPKEDWTIDPSQNTDWQTFEVILPKIELNLQRKRSPLIWFKTPEGSISRHFVVWW